MGTSEVTWRVIISGASRTSEYIVCNVDCCRVCSSHDKDCINKGINWGKIKKTKIELMHTPSSLSLSSDLVRGRQERRRAAAWDEKKSIPALVFSHARGHFRVSRVSLNGLRKREIARGLQFLLDVKHFSTGVIDFVMFRLRDFWRETLKFLNVIWPRSNQWESAQLGKKILTLGTSERRTCLGIHCSKWDSAHR